MSWFAFRKIRRDLKSENPADRFRALQSLESVEGDEAIECVKECLTDSAKQVVEAAARQLVARLEADAVPTLSAALEQAETQKVKSILVYQLSETKTEQAAQVIAKHTLLLDSQDAVLSGQMAFRRIGCAAVPTLVNVLASECSILGKNIALDALAYLRDPRAVPAICKAYGTDELRSNAISALGRIRDDQAQQALSKVLKSSKWKWREQASRLLKSQKFQPESAADQATMALANHNSIPPGVDAAIAFKVASLARQSEDAKVRELAILSLGYAQESDALDLVLASAEDPAPNVVRAVVTAIGSRKSPAGIPTLLELLSNSRDHTLMNLILVNLKQLCQLDATPLVNRWDAVTKVHRSSTISILASSSCPHAAAKLVSLMSDDDPTVRNHAVREVRTEPARYIEWLLDQVHQQPSEIQLLSIEMFGELGDLRAREPLLEFLQSEHEALQRTAALALDRNEWLKGPETGKATMLAAIAGRDQEMVLKFGERAVEPLISALQDHDPSNCAFAAELLGNLKDSRALPALQSILETHQSGRVLRLAAKAIVNIGGDDARSMLLAALAGPRREVWGIVAEVLLDFLSPTVDEFLVAHLNDGEPDRRLWCAYVLGCRGDQRAKPVLMDGLVHDWFERAAVRACQALGVGSEAREIRQRIEDAERARQARSYSVCAQCFGSGCATCAARTGNQLRLPTWTVPSQTPQSLECRKCGSAVTLHLPNGPRTADQEICDANLACPACKFAGRERRSLVQQVYYRDDHVPASQAMSVERQMPQLVQRLLIELDRTWQLHGGLLEQIAHGAIKPALIDNPDKSHLGIHHEPDPAQLALYHMQPAAWEQLLCQQFAQAGQHQRLMHARTFGIRTIVVAVAVLGGPIELP